MTVQVTTTPPGTTQTYAFDPANAAPQVPAGPGLLQFQDVLPSGELGPIWGADDLTVVETTETGLLVRFPDGTEILLTGEPQQLASLLGEIAPAAGDGGTGGGPGAGGEAGGSSGAFNAFVDDGLGNIFALGADGPVPLPGLDGAPGGGDDDGGSEDPNLILTTPATQPSVATVLGPLFTEGDDTVDLSGPISAFNGSFGPPFATDGNINFALGGNDTVQLAGIGEANNLNDLANAGTIPTDTFFGGDGNDTISGGDDEDSVVGDNGGDLTGSDVGGDDVLYGNEEFDHLYGDSDGDFLDQAIGGDDLLYGGDSKDRLHGDADSQLLDESRGGADTLYGGGGDDRVFGDTSFRIENDAIGGNDLLYGGDGDGDRVVGDAGSFLLDNATGGDDTLYGGDGRDILQADAGSDLLGNATGGDDTLFGDSGADRLYGDAGRQVRGQASGGNDLLYGGDGGDALYGDAGNDLLGSATGGDDTLYGGDGGDEIHGDASLRDNGNGGDDLIYGEDGEDNAFGGTGNDTLYGGADNDILRGGDGSDGLVDDGDDTLDGGTGIDQIFGGDNNDLILWSDGDGNDSTIFGGDGTDTLRITLNEDDQYEVEVSEGTGGVVQIEIENLTSGESSSLNNIDEIEEISIVGSNGDDTITVNPLTNTAVSNNSVSLFGGGGNDTLDGSETDRRIVAEGGANNDSITGGSQNDLLSGDGGDDTLQGGDGADTLDGGAGENDRLIYVLAENTSTDRDDYDGGAGGNDTLVLSFTATELNGNAALQQDLEDLQNDPTLLSTGFSFTGINLDVVNFETLEVITPLFTELDDDVDLNGFVGSFVPGTQYDALAGNDTVRLPDEVSDGGIAWDPSQTFLGGAGNDTITGGSQADIVSGGDDNDTIAGDDFEQDAEVVVDDDPGATEDEALDLSGNGNNVSVEIDNTDDGFDYYTFTVEDNDVLTSLNFSNQTFILRALILDEDGNQAVDTQTIGGLQNLDLAPGTYTVKIGEKDPADSTFNGPSLELTAGDSYTLNITRIAARGDELFGNDGDDSLLGNWGDDTLDGGLGDDHLMGEEDDDILFGDGRSTADPVTVTGAAGTDQASAQALTGENVLVERGVAAGDQVDFYSFTVAEDGTAVSIGVGNAPHLSLFLYDSNGALVGQDTGTPTNAIETRIEVTLAAGTYTLAVGGLNAVDGPGIFDPEDDPLEADETYDLSLIQQSGDSTGGNDTLEGGLGTDSLFGQGGDDTLIGGAGSDATYGGSGDDLILMGDGDGSDTVIDGGAGNDRLRITLERTDQYEIDIRQAVPTNEVNIDISNLVTNFSPSLDSIDNVEELEIHLSDNADEVNIFTLSETDINNITLFGYAGNDVLDGRGTNTVESDRRIEAYGGDNDDVIVGGAANDLLSGDEGEDGVFGGNGDDEIFGGGGGDFLIGEGGNDTLTGGLGSDSISGSTGDDLIVWTDGDGPDATIDGGADNDTLQIDLDTANQVVFTDGGDDWLLQVSGGTGGTTNLSYVNVEAVSVNGSDGADSFVFDDPASTAFANEATTVIGGNGTDTLVFNFTQAEADADPDLLAELAILVNNPTLLASYSFSNVDLTVESIEAITVTIDGVTVEPLFTDDSDDRNLSTFSGSFLPGTQYDALAGDDTVTLPNTINAGITWDATQTFFGGTGDDTVNGGNQNDRVVGDRLSNDNTAGAVPVALNPGASLATAQSLDGQGDNILVEAISPDGFDFYSFTVDSDGTFVTIEITEGQDTTGNELDTVLFLYDSTGALVAENDDRPQDFLSLISESLDAGTYTIVVGAIGSSDSTPNSGVDPEGDSLAAGDSYKLNLFQSAANPNGNDTLSGAGGDDTLIGDSPADFVGVALGGDDTLSGGANEDLLIGDSAGSLLEESQGGNDTLEGGGQGDTLIGDASDSIEDDARGGDDTLRGDGGDDFLVGDAGNDVLNQGGNDLLEGGAGNDMLIGDAANNLEGAGGDDTLRGGEGNDELYGDAFNGDFNEGGNDLLEGGAGSDTHLGGSGTDTFLFALEDDSGTLIDLGSDVILDFRSTAGAVALGTDADILRIEDVFDYNSDTILNVLDLDDAAAQGDGWSVSDDGTNVTVTFGDNDGDGSNSGSLGSVVLNGVGDGTIDSFADLANTITLEIAA